MNNHGERNPRRFIYFDTSLMHLHKARTLLPEHLGLNYRLLVDTASDQTKQILVFIDLDVATDDAGVVRMEHYESANLYRTHGQGKIYALTRVPNGSDFVLRHNAFTRVLTLMLLTQHKAQNIVHIFNRENDISESNIILLGSRELLAAVTRLLPPNRRGDILVDIEGQGFNQQEDPRSYSIVDYILYYLTICRISQQMREESRVAGGKCSCLAKFLHPKELVSQHYPNADKTFRLEDLNVVYQGVKNVQGKKSNIVWVEHILPSGESIELHANLKWIVLE